MNFLQAINQALSEALDDPSVLILGQLVRYGLGGLTAGLHAKYPAQIITMPVAENLMNACTMGLALAGRRPVVIHERIDFLALGMDALVNHIPIWPLKCGVKLPLVVLAVVGKGKGQGPQHSKNLTHWFRHFEGWTVVEPDSPEAAYAELKAAIFGDRPVMYVVHREFLEATERVTINRYDRVRLCGASARHEAEFYGN